MNQPPSSVHPLPIPTSADIKPPVVSADELPPLPKTNRFTRSIPWAVLNGGLAWCAWAGVHGNEGAGNLLAFAAWTFGVIQFTSGMGDSVKSSAAKKGRNIPAWLSHGVGSAMIGFLVWHGWWWTAIAYLLAELGEAAIFRRPSSSPV